MRLLVIEQVFEKLCPDFFHEWLLVQWKVLGCCVHLMQLLPEFWREVWSQMMRIRSCLPWAFRISRRRFRPSRRARWVSDYCNDHCNEDRKLFNSFFLHISVVHSLDRCGVDLFYKKLDENEVFHCFFWNLIFLTYLFDRFGTCCMRRFQTCTSIPSSRPMSWRHWWLISYSTERLVDGNQLDSGGKRSSPTVGWPCHCSKKWRPLRTHKKNPVWISVGRQPSRCQMMYRNV